ncbi:MAG: SRPBCC family protein [Bacteroidia bacterium]|nr:SRPBCC family protein [Bacteroidia bacterium]
MPIIHLTTSINAPIERCFDLSRSIDLHMASTSKPNERAIAGVTKGLINKGEQVTWLAKHFGIDQKLTAQITEMDFPHSFTDVQLKGAFKSMTHVHSFEQKGEQTIMKDQFEFESPLGFVGELFNKLILSAYMKRFLIERNEVIKTISESDEWKKYLAKN